MIGVGEFFRGATYNVAGYDPVRASNDGIRRSTLYTGWGQFRASNPTGSSFWNAANYTSTATTPAGSAGIIIGANQAPTGIMSARNTGQMVTRGARGGLSSLLGPLGMVTSLGFGYAEEGLWGAAKWGAAEFLTSGIFAGVASGALGGGATATMAGSVGGFMFGGPFGGVVGAAAGAVLGQGGLLLGGMALGGFALGVGATYLAAKGSFELLKAGYQYRQKMMHKIDTAGSTAAFMTKNAFTMRQRAVEAIRMNQLNLRSAFGQEATRQHFSAYRKYSGTRVY